MVGNFATEAQRHGGFWDCFYFISMLRVKESLCNFRCLADF